MTQNFCLSNNKRINAATNLTPLTLQTLKDAFNQIRQVRGIAPLKDNLQALILLEYELFSRSSVDPLNFWASLKY